MSHVFVSYSSQDEDFVQRLRLVLNEAGFETWIDREAIPGGAMWRRQIVEAINAADVVLIVLSVNSVNSDAVRKELDIADEARKPLLPVEAQRVGIPQHMAYQLAGVQKIDLETDFDRGAKKLLEALKRIEKGGPRPERATGSESGSPKSPKATAKPPAARRRSDVSPADEKPAQADLAGEPRSDQAPAKAGPATPSRVFTNVWYRSGDRGMLAVPVFSGIGKLSIEENRIVFGEGGGALVIETNEIQSVDFGKMTGDFWNKWVILRYVDSPRTAGFKDGTALGWGNGTHLIHAALKSAVEKRSGRSRDDLVAPLE